MSRQPRSPLRLLVPLDGSALAEQAIPYACMLGRLFPAHIHLLRVVAPGLIDRLVQLEAVMLGAAGDELGTRGEQDERMRDALRDDGTRYLKAHAPELNAHAKRVTHELVFGLPAEQIVASATRQGSDLIIMSTHGVGGMLRWALGSVSAHVLRSATQPVLLVRGVAAPPEVVSAPRRLLVALDGSPTTERILPLATRIAHAAHAELLLVRVIESTGGLLAAYGEDETVARLRERALRYLGDVARTIVTEAAEPVSTLAPVGHVAETIVLEAERKRADLIVMGRRGFGNTRFAVLGGSVEKVSQASAVPLLVAG